MKNLKERIMNMSKMEKVLGCIVIALVVFIGYCVYLGSEEEQAMIDNNNTNMYQDNNDSNNNYNDEEEYKNGDEYDYLAETDAVVETVVRESFEGYGVTFSRIDNVVNIDVVAYDCDITGYDRILIDQEVAIYEIDTNGDALAREVESYYNTMNGVNIYCSITFYDRVGNLIYQTK